MSTESDLPSNVTSELLKAIHPMSPRAALIELVKGQPEMAEPLKKALAMLDEQRPGAPQTPAP